MRRVDKAGIMAIAAVLSLSFAGISAGEFPEKPIQVLVGWPVGSQNDSMDRVIADAMRKILKQPVIVQNVPGAGGSLVLSRVKTEKPDGYTLFQTGLNLFSETPHIRSVNFDPVKDFAYLGQHARFQHFLEDRPDSPWKSFEELVLYAKNNPKKVRYSTTGVGSGQHIMMESIAAKDNLQWVHVPTQSAPETVAALLGGHVEISANTMGMEIEHVRSGRIRLLLCLNAKRSPLFPDIPTILDKGYTGFTCVAAACWAVPANTPKQIQQILEKALLQSLKEPAVKDIIEKWSMVYDPLDGETVAKMIAQDNKAFGEFAQKLGIGVYKK